jgi:hypothetical protein
MLRVNGIVNDGVELVMCWFSLYFSLKLGAIHQNGCKSVCFLKFKLFIYEGLLVVQCIK